MKKKGVIEKVKKRKKKLRGGPKKEEMNVGMYKSDIIREVNKLTQDNVLSRATVNCVFGAIKKTLMKKQEVMIRSFGTFKIKENTRQRWDIANNARTGKLEVITTKSKYRVVFKPCREVVINVDDYFREKYVEGRKEKKKTGTGEEISFK